MAKGSKTKKARSVESISRLNQLDNQKYHELKSKCLKSGTLFEDDQFTANNRSFYCKECKIEFKWLRPFQIKTNPKFYENVGFTNPINITQGKIGNFWFLGALAALTLNKEIFQQVVPTEQTFDAPEYAGIFYFRFWYFGKWKTIVVDDRLPTINGELIMAHDKLHNEFWPALLEKAYAKLVGCYEALVGSYTSEGLEDFTGGLSETYSLRPNDIPGNMFSTLYKSILRSSLICTCIETEDKECTQLENGLYKNCFYTITAVNSLELESEAKPVQLVRLRNSWQKSSDWKGSWGCQSKEWSLISDEDKQHFGLILEYEGEFWMTFDDLKANFTKLDLCNISNEKLNQYKYTWEITEHNGTWEPGVNAGGCTNSKGTFHKNPKYPFFIAPSDCDSEDSNYSTVIVGVMQKYRKSKKSTGLNDLKIGFQIYLLDKKADEDKDTKINKIDLSSINFTHEWFHENKPVAGTKCYINIREVFGRFRLKPGNYIIIPSTFQANRKGSFMLRLYHEKVDINYEIDVNYSVRPRVDSREYMGKYGLFRILIDHMSSDINSKLDSFGLLKLLKENIVSSRIGFSLDQCRTLIALFDEKREGYIDMEQFQVLCTNLNECFAIYYAFNKIIPDYMTVEELKSSFEQMGIYVGTSMVQMIMNRYGTDLKEGSVPIEILQSKDELEKTKTKNELESIKTNQDDVKNVNNDEVISSIKKGIEYTNFSICAIKLRNIILYWDQRVKNDGINNNNNSNINLRGSKRAIQFSLRELVEQVMYS